MTDDQAKRIRFLHGYNPVIWTHEALAARFGCSEFLVRDLLSEGAA